MSLNLFGTRARSVNEGFCCGENNFTLRHASTLFKLTTTEDSAERTIPNEEEKMLPTTTDCEPSESTRVAVDIDCFLQNEARPSVCDRLILLVKSSEAAEFAKLGYQLESDTEPRAKAQILMRERGKIHRYPTRRDYFPRDTTRSHHEYSRQMVEGNGTSNFVPKPRITNYGQDKIIKPLTPNKIIVGQMNSY
ncbi:hypothetical protein RUM43_011100 [Polyplax serrata]|uniref:Uncharacterized protein n=1 Tax=Polyplax serrata TaxID=468196 RepID=A0AAN8NSH4_POLSC